MSPQHLSPADPKDLESYFTDSRVSSTVQELFRQMLAAPMLSKRLLVIHGIGGIGKSALLQMLRLHCKRANVPVALTILRGLWEVPFIRKRLPIPVALASGDEDKSEVEVLSRWAEDLKINGVKLVMFAETFKRYRAIQAEVKKRASMAQEKRGKTAALAGKFASKTAEAAAGALIGAAAGSAVPIIGPLLGALGGAAVGTSAEELMDFLRGFLAEPDVDLLLNPAKKLTADFLNDIAQVTPTRRLVLMLDTFEQMTTLDAWTCDLAKKLDGAPSALLVIAGRDMVNWDGWWHGWMTKAKVHRLEPMEPGEVRELVHRYFAKHFGGEPDSAQVEQIVRFARGLPVAVTTAVRLLAKYKVEDFQEVKPEVVADLADRLMKGVPRKMKPVLEAAATVESE
jgi:hypothetical protein